MLEKKSVAEARQGLSPVAKVDRPVEVKTRIWQRGEAPKQALGHLQQQFDHIESRLRQLEKHVTSHKFQLHREFKRL